MNILHVGQYNPPRLCGEAGYYETFKRSFPLHSHRFFMVGEDTGNYFENALDIIISDVKDPSFDELLRWSDTIIMHGLLADEVYLNKLKEYQKDDRKKTVWIIWGHDLYDAHWSLKKLKKLRRSNAKSMLRIWRNEKIRKKLIYNMSFIVGEKGDVDEAFKWYQTRAEKVYYNFIVGYGTPKPIELPDNDNNGIIKVLVGNHADAHCRYLETIKLLHALDDGTMEIHLMMSGYTPEIPYVKKVLKSCQKYFPERFYPIYDWMPYEEVSKYINQMDVGIFNIDRQMGQGTALILIYYGKKVFFSLENVNYENYTSQGIKVYLMNELNKNELKSPMSDVRRNTNKECIENIMKSDYFYDTMKAIFV